MTQKLKIKRTAYTILKGNNLVIYALAIVKNCLSGEYDAYMTDIKNMDQAATTYQTALIAAESGADFSNFERKATYAQLIEKMNRLASLLELHSEVTEVFLVKTGFELHAATVKSSKNAQFAAPTILTAKSNGNRGEVAIAINASTDVVIKKFGFEHSTDKGVTWNNGEYNSRRSFTWKNLPATFELMVRARAIGTGDRVSDWSNVMTVAVL
jgi:hypothetical protein